MRNILIYIVALVAVWGDSPARAQGGRDAGRVPVLLAFVDSVPGTETGFRIVRLAGESARDVVVLPGDADPNLLTEAVETLRVVLAQSRPLAAASRDAVFRRVPDTMEPRSRRLLPWADRVLRDLREAHPRNVPGIGHVRAVQIWLAPHPSGVVPRQP